MTPDRVRRAHLQYQIEVGPGMTSMMRFYAAAAGRFFDALAGVARLPIDRSMRARPREGLGGRTHCGDHPRAAPARAGTA
jgi:hypothetical protein